MQLSPDVQQAAMQSMFQQLASTKHNFKICGPPPIMACLTIECDEHISRLMCSLPLLALAVHMQELYPCRTTVQQKTATHALMCADSAHLQQWTAHVALDGLSPAVPCLDMMQVGCLFLQCQQKHSMVPEGGASSVQNLKYQESIQEGGALLA